MLPTSRLSHRRSQRLLMILYLVPIIALPMLVTGFVVLVLTGKPPANAQPRALDATREAASALNGASMRFRPHEASGASDLQPTTR